MTGNLEKTCNICMKKMRGDDLKRHMETHKGINQEIEKKLMYRQEEFKRKLGLVRIINKYMNKNEIERVVISKDELEALGIYENHGENRLQPHP